MRQRDVAALDAKLHQKELADAKAENDALRDDACRWSSSVAHRAVVCQSVRSHHALRRDNAASPRLADTALNGIISPPERG